MVCLEGLKGNKHLFCFCPLPLCRLRKKHLWPLLLSCIQFKTVFIMVSTTFCFAFQFPPFSVPSIGFSSIRPHSISPSYPRSLLHTVPNLHFWSKNSTFWKICSDVIFSFCIGFDGTFEIKMPKKLTNFEFLPKSCSMRRYNSKSNWLTKVTALPARPARAVLPTRWM